jgi:VWFA-related protein
VIVDVVVTDKNDAPVANLEAEDFTVLEDGKPQKVSGFSIQKPASSSAGVTEPAPLPPGVVSNAPRFKAEGALTIVLLDALNGDFAGNAYARERLLKYFETTSSVRPTAVYALQDSGLSLLHDVTSDTNALRKTIAGFQPRTQARPEHTLDATASPFATHSAYSGNTKDIGTTLQALHSLARGLIGYPGRKNLVWVSHAFPLTLAGESMSFRNFSPPAGASTESPDYSLEIAKIADEFMAAQVAVYPVDSAAVGKDDTGPSHTTMNDLAQRTGGKAYYNRNDIEVGVSSSINDGSTYYTLTYYPENKKWDGKFRQISVTTNKPGVHLRYRLGYYALDPLDSGEAAPNRFAAELSQALTLNAASRSAVIFQAKVTAQRKLVVDFVVDSKTLLFADAGNGTGFARVSCAVVAFSQKGAVVSQQLNNMQPTASPADSPKQPAQWMPCQVTSELNPGKYTLRLGVADRLSQLIGTTTASVTVP